MTRRIALVWIVALLAAAAISVPAEESAHPETDLDTECSECHAELTPDAVKMENA